jgi:fructokinase
MQKSKALKQPVAQNTKKNSIALFGEVLADVFPDKSILGGAPYNVARHLQAFGLKPLLITRVGCDALRDEFIADMTRLGMDDSGVQYDNNHPTGKVLVQMEETGHQFDILPKQAYDYIHAGVAHLVTMKAHPSMVYFGTLAQRNLDSRLALDAFLSKSHGSRFLDINLRAPWYDRHIIRRSLLRADIVKLNKDELQVIAGLLRLVGTDSRALGLNLRQRFNLKVLLVTDGDNGAWMLSENGSETHSVGHDLHGSMVDTVGAGDGFAAMCMLGILQNWPAEDMLYRANAFAAALCGVRGAAPPDADFYQPFLEEIAHAAEKQ